MYQLGGEQGLKTMTLALTLALGSHALVYSTWCVRVMIIPCHAKLEVLGIAFSPHSLLVSLASPYISAAKLGRVNLSMLR
jgi:hypothetical protein